MIGHLRPEEQAEYRLHLRLENRHKWYLQLRVRSPPFVFRMQINWRCCLHSFSVPGRMALSTSTCDILFSSYANDGPTQRVKAHLVQSNSLRRRGQSTKGNYSVSNAMRLQWKLRNRSLDIRGLDRSVTKILIT